MSGRYNPNNQPLLPDVIRDVWPGEGMPADPWAEEVTARAEANKAEKNWKKIEEAP